MLSTDEKIRLALDAVSEAHGGILRPEDVVDAARSPSSILHVSFTWDDQRAATERRLEQARQLIRGIRYVRHDSRTSTPVVAYVRNPDAPRQEQGYVETLSLANDQDRAREVIDQELVRIESLLLRARGLAIGVNQVEYLSSRLQEFASQVLELPRQ